MCPPTLETFRNISTWFNKPPTGRTVSIFIDAERAFDSVWHDGLRTQLQNSNFPIKIIRWISSFLRNRRGRVKVNNCISIEVFLVAGVPQGSIISPLIYIFYIKGMPTKISEEILSSFYADDTSYAASDTQHKSRKNFVSGHLQTILNDLENFCKIWRITLNPGKTWCTNFFLKSSDNNCPRLWLKGELLKYKKEAKFLGFTFDQNLSHKAHILDVVNRCKKRLNLLKAIQGKTWGASPSTILYTYKVYIRPLLEYGSILFAHASDSLLKKIQAIETAAIKIAYRLPPWTTNRWCYSFVNFEKILDRIKSNSKKFLNNYKEDELIKPLIMNAKPSLIGQHSAVFKALNW